MNVFELRSLFTYCLIEKLMLTTLQATQQNKREMYDFKGLRRLKTNPYVDINKLRNNRRYNLNYDYQDWEKKRPDFYDDLFTTSKVFSTSTSTTSTTLSLPLPTTISTDPTTRSTIGTTISIPTTTKDAITNTIPTTVNETTTAISTSIENTTTNTNVTTTVTDLSIVPTTFVESLTEATSLISSNITTSTTPITSEVTTTTSTLSPATSVNTSVQETTTVLTTTPSTTSVMTIFPETTSEATTVSPFVTEIKDVKDKLRSGYFSASLIVILRAIAKKEPTDLLGLMLAFHGVMTGMISDREFEFLGTPVVDMFTIVNDLMIQQNPKVVQEVAKETAELLLERRSNFEPDTNTIMDVVDTIYVEEDAANIAAVLDHLKRFPATDMTGEQMSHEGLEALLFTPWGRVAGDPRERLLRLELEAAIQQRVPTETDRRRGGGGKVADFRKERVNWKKNYSKDYLRTSDTSTVTETTQEYQYLKNATIMERLRKRMSSYRVKMRRIRHSESKVKTRRGPTTTSTTTTVKPTMHKGKYYRMKKVRKNLRRRKNVTTTSTTFRWRYYGEVKRLKKVPYRKFEYYNIQRKGEDSCESKRHIREKTDFDKTLDSDSDSYYSETDSSYEEENMTVEFNNLEARRAKNGESYERDVDSNTEDYESNRNYKNNEERSDIRKYHHNWKAIEPYTNNRGFDNKLNKYSQNPKRDYVNNKKRKYVDDLKVKEPFTSIYSIGNSKYKRNRNRYLSITKINTRPAQIRHAINVKNYNWKAIEPYTNNRGFENKLSKYSENVNNKKRKYDGDLKVKEPFTSIYSIRNSNNNRNRNRFLSRTKINARPAQIRHAINVKKYKSFTKSYRNRFDENETKINDSENLLNINKNRLNDVILHYFKKIMSRNVVNNKFNDRFDTMKLHKNRAFHELGKNTKSLLKYKKVESNSDSINDESLLKANLEDAMFHREELRGKMKIRRNLEVKVNEFLQMNSMSDDEVKLKGTIYKFLGLKDNFGKQLRTIH